MGHMGDFIQKIEVPQLVDVNSTYPLSMQSFPLTGINVLIIGAGVGGLTAALEYYRKGHNVRIFERESRIRTAGK
jgi:NADPH-dependent glutamate synthase beta subunit-like oxidoreductase